MNQAITIKSKNQLTTMVYKNLPKYKLVEENFRAVIENLLRKETLSNLLAINLIRYLATDEKPISNFEEYLSKKTFTNLDEPISRLKSNFREYYAVIAELETAWRLNEEGMQDIKFLPHEGNPDIEYKHNDQIRFAEVKNLEEINPEFTILNDKLEAESLRNSHFKRSFFMDCQYDITDHENIKNLHKDINHATTLLVRELRKKLRTGEVDETFTFKQIRFNISTKKAVDFILMYHGSGFVYSSPKDAFMQFSSTYTRMISNFRKGYIQLMRKRSNDKNLVIMDRIYIYLNLGRGYNAFIDKDANKVFRRLAKATEMSELVDLKIII